MRIDIDEALRYLGVVKAGGAERQAVEATARALEQRVTPRYVYRVFSVEKRDGGVFLPEAGLTLPGELAQRMLDGCHQAALLCCTLGAGFERMLRAAQVRDMAQAVVLDACGSAWVEAGCGAAEEDIADRSPGLYRTDRFSPGYGDLPLAVQEGLLRALDGERRLGVCLLPSLLLAPGKTVTAILGLSNVPQPARIRGCGACALRNTCAYRERGTSCGAY